MVKTHVKHFTLLALAVLTLTACSSKSSTFDKLVDKAMEQALEETGSSSKPSKAKKEEVVHKIGDTFTVGDVEYTVQSKELADRVGNEYFGENANGQYVIISVTIKNNGKESITLSDNYFKLIKGETEYEADSSAGIYVKDDTGANLLYSELNPENSATGKVVFDVNPDTASDPSLQLQVQTGYWGTETALISLNQ